MKTTLTTLLALLCFAAPARGVAIAGITLTDLGAGVVPKAINSNGVVVGQNASGQAFVWQNGTMTVLPTLGGTGGAANDINDSGTVVGWSYTGDSKKGAFKWTPSGGIVNLYVSSSYDFTAEAIKLERCRGGVVHERDAYTVDEMVIHRCNVFTVCERRTQIAKRSALTIPVRWLALQSIRVGIQTKGIIGKAMAAQALGPPVSRVSIRSLGLTIIVWRRGRSFLPALLVSR